MRIFTLEMADGSTHTCEAETFEQAKTDFYKWQDDFNAALVKDGEQAQPNREVVGEVAPPKPDNSYTEEDGGFKFTAWGIHVAGDNLEVAKKHVKEWHGIDVDTDPVPSKAGKS